MFLAGAYVLPSSTVNTGRGYAWPLVVAHAREASESDEHGERRSEFRKTAADVRDQRQRISARDMGIGWSDE